MPDKSIFTDQAYLKTEQYKTAANLNARINLHLRFSANHHGWQRWVFDQLDLTETASLLELGCGQADLWASNLSRIPTCWQVTLSDLSAGMLAAAENRLGLASSRFTLRCFDAQSIPCETAAFDAVIANHMLYHVPDLDRALSEISRVIKPGGSLYAAANGPQHLTEIYDLVSPFWPAAESWQRSLLLSFRLDNGAALLERFFGRLRLLRYPDQLVITAAAPLVDYILSMAGRDQEPISADQFAALTRAIEGEINAQGAYYVTKDPGLFIARKGSS